MNEHSLTEGDLTALRRLRDGFAAGNGWAICKTNPPSERLQSLVERGYCRLSPGRSGPLGLFTGEMMIKLTEAGKLALPVIEAALLQPEAATQ